MRTNTLPTWSPPVTRRRPWTAACWIPAGFAITRFVDDGTPIVAVMCLAAGAAGLHRIFPGVVEVVAGAGGFLLTLLAAGDGWGYGTAAVLAYGSVMTVSAFVRLLGSGNGREMAKHLLVATAALQLTVLAGGGTATEPDALPVLAAVLLTATVVGLRARHGFAILGTAVLVTLAWLAVTDTATAVDPMAAMVGSATFAIGAYAIADRQNAHVAAEMT